MKQKHLGSHGPAVPAIGLGCMRMSRVAAPVDLTKDAESIATIQSAIDYGISYLDTGDFSGMGRGEALVGQAIKGRRDKVFLSVKFGAMISPSLPARSPATATCRPFRKYPPDSRFYRPGGHVDELACRAGQPAPTGCT